MLCAVIGLLVVMIVLLSVNITTIEVTGNERYTREQMTELLFPDSISRNSLFCYLKDHFREHRQIPFVEDYRIAFQGPTHVEVIVYEKDVVGYVSYMSSYMYFDKDGILVESSNEKLPGVPWITGLDFGQIILYRRLPVSDESIFQEILNLTQILSIYEMEVDQIHYNSFGEATLQLGDIQVILGGNESLNGKIAELNDMLPQLAGRKGVLHLENYNEANITAGYAFEPKE